MGLSFAGLLLIVECWASYQRWFIITVSVNVMLNVFNYKIYNRVVFVEKMAQPLLNWGHRSCKQKPFLFQLFLYEAFGVHLYNVCVCVIGRSVCSSHAPASQATLRCTWCVRATKAWTPTFWLLSRRPWVRSPFTQIQTLTLTYHVKNINSFIYWSTF